MLRLRDISKTYIVDEEDIRFFEALKSVNITLTKNEFVVILGKSGSGKSTLLNIIAGIDSFDNGTYYYFDNRINKFEETHFDYFRSKKLGMVFQNYYLIDHLSVLENVIIAQRFGNQNKINVFQAKQALKEVGLSGYEAKYPYQLSSGERQRVAIAKSIVNQPHIIIADEPTGNLDSVTSKEILDLFKRLSKDRMVIMVTHDEDAAVIYADRVIQIDDGRVILDYKVTDTSSILEDQEVIFKKRSNPLASITYGIKQLYIYKFKLLGTVLLLSLSLGFLAGTIFYQKGYQNAVNQMVEELSSIQSTLISTNSPLLQNQDFDEMSETIKSSLGQSVEVIPYHNLNLWIMKFNNTKIQSRILIENVYPYITDTVIDEFKIYDDGRTPSNTQEILLSYEDALTLVRVDSIKEAWKLLKGAELEIPYETFQEYNYQKFVTEISKPSPLCFTYTWNQINDPINFEQYGVGTFATYQTLLQNRYGMSGLLYQGNEYFVCSESFLITNSIPIMASQLKPTQIKETITLKVVGIIENRYQRISYINQASINDMIGKNHALSNDYVQIYYPQNVILLENGLDYHPIEYISNRLDNMIENKMNDAQTTIIIILFVLFGLTIAIGFSNQVNMQAIKERKAISIIRTVGASKQDVRTIYLAQGIIIGLIIVAAVHLISVVTLLVGNLWINVTINNTMGELFMQRPLKLFQFDYLTVLILSTTGLAISIIVYFLIYQSYAKEKIIHLIRNK